ncbi:glucosaminidase domain-containing protein [Kineobactrum salinum]|uniref:Bax protein n=1 Tax=Kineobactrum salinum TaxID=2708301 RepID=A0A6C0U8K1_9GAMM|nr:glucosaminidase domain-containing protein [Kineobactrum salinum]QIB65864.1 Bax protein [Kineobactrum salinum]
MEQDEQTQRYQFGRRTWSIAIGVVLMVCACLWYMLRDTSSNLPDFSRFEQTSELKTAFFSYLEPIVERQNEALREQRSALKTIAAEFEADGSIGLYHRWRLNRLAETYGVPEGLDTGKTIQTLLLRIDIVPLELAAVQAAKESAWGRSRFAVQANNLFGHWCFTPGCGVVPSNRGAGQHHELKAYDSVSEAIANYMLNLNTHPKYLKFRQLRAQLREAEERLSGMALAEGLLYYSERREAYIREIKAMIGQYREFTSETEGRAQT